MRKLALTLAILCLPGIGLAQTKPRPKPRPTPAVVPVKPSVDMGKVSGRTYTNSTFGIDVTFPDTWLIPDSDFESYMKKQGFDLSLKAPDSLPPSSKAVVDQAIKRVHILVTAYRS